MNHSFDIELAKKYGMAEAVIIANFQFWIAKNKANQRHHYDGKTWTYNSVKAMGELFPYMTGSQIRRSVERLVEAGVLVRGNYNPSPYDRTCWFAFSDAFSSVFCDDLELSNQNLPFVKNDKSTNTDINTDTPQSPKGFEEVYQAYPKKVGKPAAMKAFKAAKLKPDDVNTILADLAKRKQSADWTKDAGQFIPHPATYLNQRRWEDAVEAPESTERTRYV